MLCGNQNLCMRHAIIIVQNANIWIYKINFWKYKRWLVETLKKPCLYVTQPKSHNQFRPVENSIAQCCAAHIVQCIVNNVIQVCYTWSQADLGWTILLTTLNNVGRITLFNVVLNSPDQVVRFLLYMCKSIELNTKRELSRVSRGFHGKKTK